MYYDYEQHKAAEEYFYPYIWGDTNQACKTDEVMLTDITIKSLSHPQSRSDPDQLKAALVQAPVSVTVDGGDMNF